jgi:hypothetical protein
VWCQRGSRVGVRHEGAIGGVSDTGAASSGCLTSPRKNRNPACLQAGFRHVGVSGDPFRTTPRMKSSNTRRVRNKGALRGLPAEGGAEYTPKAGMERGGDFPLLFLFMEQEVKT